MTNDDKISTGVRALDDILNGGLTPHSVNVIAGPPGTGKTILAQQILFHNVQQDQQIPYLVTVSEPTAKMLRYSQRFTFFELDKIGKSLIYLDIGSILLEHGLEEVLHQIEQYVQTYSPSMLAIDSFKAIHEMAEGAPQLREFAYRLAVQLTAWETTTLLVGEYTRETINDAPIFAIADGIVLLDQESRGMQTYRYLEVLKMRGDDYFAGKHPFRITSQGLRVFPRVKTSETTTPYMVSGERVSLGISGLDEMTEGGVIKGTSTLVAGSAGTGKTMHCLHFLLRGIERNEPGLLITFQETPSMLYAFARGFGWDLERLQKEGKLSILYSSPVELGVDEHTHLIQQALTQSQAQRVALDSLKDIELATPDKVRYKDYVYSMVNSFRRAGITSMLTSEIPEMFGAFIVSEYGISFVSDNVILLRYVELGGSIARAVSVLKMRGSNHAKGVHEYRIERDKGITILAPFTNYESVLSGPVQSTDIPGASMLPPLLRRLLTLIITSPGISVSELAEKSGESDKRVSDSMEVLIQLGYIIRQSKDNEAIFKATMS